MCPSLRIIEARHELYVQYHHRIVDAVNTCVPVTVVVSIDEMACRLMGRECPVENAQKLARAIKQTIREKVGSTLRCSIGLAPNRFLGKVASDMQKPDGLTVLCPSQLPTNLYGLKPENLPGVGPRMKRRLERHGILTMEQLCSRSSGQMRNIWGSVLGERIWHWLRGADFEEHPEEFQKSVGHQHVLPPDLRTMEGAAAVGEKLLHKAAVRLRRMKMWAGGLGVHVRFAPWREGKFWESHTRILECQDTLSLMETLRKLWSACPSGKPSLVGVTLYDLVPESRHTLSLFEEQHKQLTLCQTMDSINAKYGGNTLYLGGLHDVRNAAPTRIAFSSIPEFD